MPKGSLPIEIVIVLVLGVLVIVAVLMFFMGSFKPAAGGTSLQVATQNTCLVAKNSGVCSYITSSGTADVYRALRLPVYDFDANGNGILNPNDPDDDSLQTLCIHYYNCPTWSSTDHGKAWAECCLVGICGCPRLS